MNGFEGDGRESKLILDEWEIVDNWLCHVQCEPGMYTGPQQRRCVRVIDAFVCTYCLKVAPTEVGDVALLGRLDTGLDNLMRVEFSKGFPIVIMMLEMLERKLRNCKCQS
jgi:hypothetical protein